MNTGRHYELTNETIEFDGHTLHRIICTKSFCNVLKGTLGGFIEGYENLEGTAWVGDEAKVYDGAEVNCYASVVGHACVSRCAYISDRAIVGDNASVSGRVFIGDGTCIFNDTLIKPTRGTIVIKGAAKIIGDAVIESKHDWIVFKNWWSSGRFFTWTRSNDMWAVGCFYGTGKELIAKAYRDSYISGQEYERVVRYVEEIKKGSKPSLWRRILFNLTKLCK
nr:MAG TPA: Putative transferase, nesg, ydcK, Structural Genomics.38A [Crassvirales sp.]